MRIGLLLAAGVALTAAACATPQAYGPASEPGDAGYFETQIESNRYRVTFTGAPGTPRASVETFALRRAAEVAQSRGADWFRVVRQATDAERSAGGSSVGVGLGGGSYGGRSGIGGGVGLSFGGGGAERYVSVIEILLGEGVKPDNDPGVYSVSDVIATTNV